jgi:hypothetical protein
MMRAQRHYARRDGIFPGYPGTHFPLLDLAGDSPGPCAVFFPFFSVFGRVEAHELDLPGTSDRSKIYIAMCCVVPLIEDTAGR